MNKETYEALKRVVEMAEYTAYCNKNNVIPSPIWNEKDINQVESWIDEVSKEYQEGGESDRLIFTLKNGKIESEGSND